ncbi:hypothetical protein ASPCADRAFT_209695 [Aspergillus carbonarius ITEM 5010]|uniref:Uncharacterized protein n=1 Tax=Aspergillus carbonarius (strain ITEM 5010) TaxID=602072 RepID=A0A1R3RF06_ASPC5|nr:hypothetical protein ASPCADRAFT_209695 [Aspergillus carbonarius ITEM 5010]
MGTVPWIFSTEFWASIPGRFLTVILLSISPDQPPSCSPVNIVLDTSQISKLLTRGSAARRVASDDWLPGADPRNEGPESGS